MFNISPSVQTVETKQKLGAMQFRELVTILSVVHVLDLLERAGPTIQDSFSSSLL